MHLSLRSIKTNNWSADNCKKHVNSMSCTLEPAIQSADTLFDSFQLTITCHKDVHKDDHYQVKHRLYMPLTSTMLDKIDRKFVPLPPIPPNQGWKNGAFWLLRGFSLDLGGWGFAVPFCYLGVTQIE